MQYTDGRGRRQRLTFTQFVYLESVPFDQGWGGLSSTLTMRLLRERGLVTADDRRVPWRITGLTKLGSTVLDRWRERYPIG